MVPSYGIMIDKATKFYIYHFEAKTYSRCKLEKLQKVIEINDQEVVIVEKTNQGYIFKSEICMPVLNKKNNLWAKLKGYQINLIAQSHQLQLY